MTRIREEEDRKLPKLVRDRRNFSLARFYSETHCRNRISRSFLLGLQSVRRPISRSNVKPCKSCLKLMMTMMMIIMMMKLKVILSFYVYIGKRLLAEQVYSSQQQR